MTRQEYYDKVKNILIDDFKYEIVDRWDDPEWQELLSKMYNDFAAYSPEKQQRLIKSAGPQEPFWDRVAMDAAFTYDMLF